MTPEHEANLRARFPLLYSEPYLACDPGMRCGDGWFAIIERLSEQLEALIAAEHEFVHFRAMQVKEKLGTLRFYMSTQTASMTEAIAEAEDESARVCEHCGQVGKLRSGGWIRTLCDACHDVSEKEKARRKP